MAAVGVGGGLAMTASADEATDTASASASASSTAEACYQLTSETTEGPYYIDADKLRQDITEDKEGIPLTLTLKVIDSETCKPVAGAAVDIWHCDALGLYSGYESFSQGGGTAPTDAPTDMPSGTPTGEPPSGAPTGGGGGGHEEPTSDTRYLRGTWKTDKKGCVTFTTVFPGWYQGRCVHIHQGACGRRVDRRRLRAGTPATPASSSSTRRPCSSRRRSSRTRRARPRARP